jgi:hypothetical protein
MASLFLFGITSPQPQHPGYKFAGLVDETTEQQRTQRDFFAKRAKLVDPLFKLREFALLRQQPTCSVSPPLLRHSSPRTL